MGDIVMRVEQLSKRYRIGVRQDYKALRDTLTSLFQAPSRSNDQPGSDNFIWAIKDVSFEIKQGDVVGIVGRNGAGKSTLLRILSRITQPTSGHAWMRGRVSSLLEVGTGFHPELTGRENLYLNGAILGMSKRHIDRKFDEIVAFAEVEKFIDTPVKYFSSGMYVRLAFAVAAHLETDILLIDEVLAVGDVEFQKKCMGKMGDISKHGRTVLFVSHNMHAVSLLCPSTILLNGGKIAAQGPTGEVIAHYLSSEMRTAESLWSFEVAPGSPRVKLHAVRARDHENNASYDIDIDKPITLEVEFWITQKTRMTPSFRVYNQQGILLFAVGNMHDETWGQREYEPGLYRSACTIPGNYLNDGEHYVTVYLTRDNNASLIDLVCDHVISFRVRDTGAARGEFVHKWLGLVRPILPWTASRIGGLPPSVVTRL